MARIAPSALLIIHGDSFVMVIWPPLLQQRIFSDMSSLRQVRPCMRQLKRGTSYLGQYGRGWWWYSQFFRAPGLHSLHKHWPGLLDLEQASELCLCPKSAVASKPASIAVDLWLHPEYDFAAGAGQASWHPSMAA